MVSKKQMKVQNMHFWKRKFAEHKKSTLKINTPNIGKKETPHNRIVSIKKSTKMA